MPSFLGVPSPPVFDVGFRALGPPEPGVRDSNRAAAAELTDAALRGEACLPASGVAAVLDLGRTRSVRGDFGIAGASLPPFTLAADLPPDAFVPVCRTGTRSEPATTASSSACAACVNDCLRTAAIAACDLSLGALPGGAVAVPALAAAEAINFSRADAGAAFPWLRGGRRLMAMHCGVDPTDASSCLSDSRMTWMFSMLANHNAQSEYGDPGPVASYPLPAVRFANALMSGLMSTSDRGARDAAPAMRMAVSIISSSMQRFPAIPTNGYAQRTMTAPLTGCLQDKAGTRPRDLNFATRFSCASVMLFGTAKYFG